MARGVRTGWAEGDRDGNGADVRMQGSYALSVCPRGVEHNGMEQPERIHTYDDELHDRRRRLAIQREPIDFQAERLKRLIEKSRDTRDP